MQDGGRAQLRAEREVVRCEKVLTSKRSKFANVEKEVDRLRRSRRLAVVGAEAKLADAKTRLSASKKAKRGAVV